MPQSDGQERTELGDDDRKELSDSVAQDGAEAFTCLAKEFGHGHRIEDVVAAPVAEGNVPAVPELGQVMGKIRAQEVVRHINAHALGQTSGDVDAATEICVDLNHIEKQAHENGAPCVFCVIAEDLVHQDSRPVRDDEFLEKSPQNQFRSMRQIPVVESMPFVELIRQLIISADRSLDDLREERREKREFGDVPVRFDLVSVQIEDVRCRLEGVERDPQWNQDASRIKNTCRLQVIPEVFEYSKNAEIKNENEDDHFPLPGLGSCFGRLLFFF